MSGIGPELTYSTIFGDIGMNAKLKCVHEFGAKQRFESDIFWGNLTFAF